MTRLLTSVGALALAAIACACPGHAMPKGGLQACLYDCTYVQSRHARWHCQDVCAARYPNGVQNASVRQKPKPNPVAVTGAPTRPTQHRR